MIFKDKNKNKDSSKESLGSSMMSLKNAEYANLLQRRFPKDFHLLQRQASISFMGITEDGGGKNMTAFGVMCLLVIAYAHNIWPVAVQSISTKPVFGIS